MLFADEPVEAGSETEAGPDADVRPTVLVIGDSVLSGLATSYGAPARAVLGDRYRFVLDAEGFRRLISPGCRTESPPPSALFALEQLSSMPYRALVIAAGYNDMTGGNVGVGAAVDQIMAEAGRQGIGDVVWLTYRVAGDEAHVAQYEGHNATLHAKAAEYPNLHLADWAAVSRTLPEDWFSADGLHLGADSATAMAELIADTLDATIRDLPDEVQSGPVGSSLTVLVPVRNGEHLLPSWLDDVGRYADAVIALDDGSTDRTRRILEEHPLVTCVLTNPVRPTYEGWDDLENRHRLIDAARNSSTGWLLFLDADERLDPADAKALVKFLETDAQPGFAYGFEVFRMVDDDRHFDPRSLWVFRLFAARDATTPLPSKRLHFVPVPEGIPRERWLFTSLRIQHAGSLTDTHRQARYDKYRQADPDNECQNDYTGLLAEPVVAEWPDRRDDLPVLLGTAGRYADQHISDQSTGPAITAVVIAQNDVDVIGQAVSALVDQAVDDDFEVVVVCSGSDGTYERVRREHPTVRAVQLPERVLPGEARNAGLWMAGGEYVTFPGSHVRLRPGSLQARLDAHDDGWDLVTGSVVNGNPTRAGWASYLLDHAAQVPSRKPGEFNGVPGHASYVTRDVRGVGGFPEDIRAGEDTVVNRSLFFAGKRTYFCPAASFAHTSPSTGPIHLLRHHFQRGRALGRIIRKDGGWKVRLAQVRATTSLPKRRLTHINTALDAAGDDVRRQYRGLVRLYVAVGAVAAATGTWYQLLTHKAPAGPDATPATAVESAASTGPVLVLSGRPGEASTGLLAAGTAIHATTRLQTFARYAGAVSAVRPALAPIVTSATVTAEQAGTYTVNLAEPVVATYLRATRAAGATLLLQIQPGRSTLTDVIEHWREFIAEPDVGVYFDLRDDVAFANQHNELEHAVRLVRAIGGNGTLVLVRGADVPGVDVVPVGDTIDLRRTGAQLPHDVLTANPNTEALVYE